MSDINTLFLLFYVFVFVHHSVPIWIPLLAQFDHLYILDNIKFFFVIFVHLARVVEQNLFKKSIIKYHILVIIWLVKFREWDIHHMILHIFCVLNIKLRLVPVQINKACPSYLEMRRILKQGWWVYLNIKFYVCYCVLIFILPHYLLFIIKCI